MPIELWKQSWIRWTTPALLIACSGLCIAAPCLGSTPIVDEESEAGDSDACDESPEDSETWPSWRGPNQNGTAPGNRPPVYWDEETNVRWKVEVPGLGHSTPIVWGDRIFLTSAMPVGEKFAPIRDEAPGSHDNLAVEQRHQFMVVAFDRNTGDRLWSKVLNELIPHEGAHYTASLASQSPVTDGTHVYASFGSHGIYCLDFDGRLVWEKSLGTMNTKHGHGEGSSLALSHQTLVVNWDHEGESMIVALDTADGDVKWKKERAEVTSWSSPVVAQVGDQTQLIVSGTDRVRAYDLEDGSMVWECGGLSHNIVASPVVADGIVIVGSSYELKAMLAIRLEGASGDLTDSEHVLWTRDRSTPYVPSPVIYDGSVYYLSHYQGIMSRVELESGDEPTGPFRLDRVRDVYASLAAADDRIYVVDRDGFTTVVSADEIPRLVSRNRLDDRFSASPVFVGDQLILRGESFLYCLEDESR